MRALIWLIGIFALAVGVAKIAGVNDGYVLVVLSPCRAQISLNLFIVLLVAGVLLIHLLLRVLTRTLALPSRVAQWRDRRRRDKADKALHGDINALFEGRFAQSLKSASTAYARRPRARRWPRWLRRVPPTACRTRRAHREWLDHAAEQGKDSEVARLMTEAELAIESRQFDVASARLAQLREGGHKHIAMLRLESEVALALGRWEKFVASSIPMKPKANQKAAEGYQNMMRRQAEIMTETMQAIQESVADLMKANGGKDLPKKQAELVEKTIGRALKHMKEIAELAITANGDAFKVMQERAKESIGEMQELAKKISAGRK